MGTNSQETKTPYIWAHSNLGSDGTEYITVAVEEPGLNERDLYEGGMLIHFDIDNRKQTTEAWQGHFHRGGFQYDKTLHRWKDEVLGESECLKYCENMAGK